MSTPPLVKASTPPDAARRARALSRWLTGEYPRDVKNLKVFDLFDALAITSGQPGGDTLAPQFATGLGDSHPSPEGARAVTRLFIPWFNRVVREAGLRVKQRLVQGYIQEPTMHSPTRVPHPRVLGTSSVLAASDDLPARSPPRQVILDSTRCSISWPSWRASR